MESIPCLELLNSVLFWTPVWLTSWQRKVTTIISIIYEESDRPDMLLDPFATVCVCRDCSSCSTEPLVQRKAQRISTTSPAAVLCDFHVCTWCKTLQAGCKVWNILSPSNLQKFRDGHLILNSETQIWLRLRDRTWGEGGLCWLDASQYWFSTTIIFIW